MKKFLTTIFLLAISLNARAEIIDIRNEEKTFGDWKVFCEVDEMMAVSHCKIAAKFYDNASSITVQPLLKSANQFFVIIPQIKVGSFVKLRVDQNDLLLSKNVSDKDFGMIPLSEQQKAALFNQMKTGEFLFMRFDPRESEKEVTVKLDLKDFRGALAYFNSRNQSKKHN